MKSKKFRSAVEGYLYLLPALILFLTFFLIPIIAIVVLSFTKYDMVSPLKFVGLSNYIKLFTRDSRFLPIVWNTIKYVLIFVPAHMILGFLLALGINRKISSKLQYIYRTVTYFPVLVTTSAVSIVWIYMYDKEFGCFNYYLSKLNIEAIPWLTSSTWAYVAIALFGIWKFVGQPTLYYLVGIQNLPVSVVEAADIDGASVWQKFTKVVLPMISPTTFFVGITVLINTLQIFDAPFILTRGGPGDATRSLNLYIYEYAYERYDLGYASTLSLSLFLLILFMTFLVFIISQKRINYGDD